MMTDPTRFFRQRFSLHASLICFLLAACAAAGIRASSDGGFGKTRLLYAGLHSYADTGVVVTESSMPGGPVLTERHTFTTYYRAPRHFYFDFKKDKKAGGDRFVIWCDGGDFQSWWSTTGSHDDYPKGQGGDAFALAVYPTKGSALQIVPLLFAQSGLRGTLTNLINAADAGTENMEGRRCYKLTGVTRDIYAATGKEVNVRRTTVWIDQETHLVRKVFEDTPRGLLAGAMSRITTTFSPKANPEIEDSRFSFEVPDQN